MITAPTHNISKADVLLKIARELYELYNSKMNELPYSMNIISELHANEKRELKNIARIASVLIQW